MKRKIAAIVAADVAGYSKLVAQDEEGTLARLEERRKIFADAIARLNGRVFNTAGDAIMAEFASAVDALRCSIEVQNLFAALNGEVPPERRMEYRVGLTIGDVVERDGDLLGDGVNIAARLEGIAPIGGICISRSVYEATLNKISVRFEDKGNQRLKNIAEPVHAYIYAPNRALSPKFQVRRSHGAAAAIFVLCGAAYWFVTGNAAKLPVAAPEVTADKESASHLKKETADNTRQASGAETTVADGPAQAPKGAAPSSTMPTVAAKEDEKAPSKSDQAHDLSTCLAAALEQAIEPCNALLAQVDLQPVDKAKAGLRLGQAYRKRQDPKSSLAVLTRAISFSPSAEAYNLRGIAHYDLEEWAEAIDDYSKAISLDPNNGEALNNRAWTYFKTGRLEEGLADADSAVNLLAAKDYVWDTRGHIHEALGHRDQAIVDYTRALAIDPFNVSSRDGLKRLTTH